MFLQKQRTRTLFFLLVVITTATTAYGLVMPHTGIRPIRWQANPVPTQRSRNSRSSSNIKLRMDTGTNSGYNNSNSNNNNNNNNHSSSNDDGNCRHQRRPRWIHFVRGGVLRAYMKTAMDGIFLYDDIDGVGSRSVPSKKRRQRRRRRLSLFMFNNRRKVNSYSYSYSYGTKTTKSGRSSIINNSGEIRKRCGAALVTVALSLLVREVVLVASGSVSMSSRRYQLLQTLANFSILALYGWMWCKVLMAPEPGLLQDEAAEIETTTKTTAATATSTSTSTATSSPTNRVEPRQPSAVERESGTDQNSDAKIIDTDDDPDREIRTAFFPPPMESIGRSEMMSF